MRVAEKMRKGAFDLADLRDQLDADAEDGRHGGLMGMMPGVAKMKNQIANAGLDEKVLKRQIAIINSMTPQERRNPGPAQERAARSASPPAPAPTPEQINKLAENASRHGRHDEGDGQRQARPDGRPRPDAWACGGGMPIAGADGRNGQENAGRAIAAGLSGRRSPAIAADYAGTAAEHAGPARPRHARKIPRHSGPSRLREKEITAFDFNQLNDQRNVQQRKTAMSLVIRMARAGTKKRPFYHIVVADSRSPRDGRFIERLGYFNPLLPKDKKERLKLDLEKVKAWMAKGAQPSDRVMPLPRRRRRDEAREAQQSGRRRSRARSARRCGRSAKAKEPPPPLRRPQRSQGRRSAADRPLPREVAAADADARTGDGRSQVCVAQIGAAHGVRGEVRLRSFTARPAGRRATTARWRREDGKRTFEIESVRAGEGSSRRAHCAASPTATRRETLTQHRSLRAARPAAGARRRTNSITPT